VPWEAIIANHETVRPSGTIMLVGEVASSFANVPVRTAVAVVEGDLEGSAGAERVVCLFVAQTELSGEWASALSCQSPFSRTFFDNASTSTMFVWFSTRRDVLAVAAPQDTAVVALESTAGRLWQRPRGGVTLFNVDTTLVAMITFYEASGAVLGRMAIPRTG
jgi:hypothetical protein